MIAYNISKSCHEHKLVLLSTQNPIQPTANARHATSTKRSQTEQPCIIALTDTKGLRNKRQFTLWPYFYTKLSHFHNRTRFLTLLYALFGLAPFGVDNSDTSQMLIGVLFLFGILFRRHFSFLFSIFKLILLDLLLPLCE